MLLALHGHPDSGGIWEQHLNSRVVKQGWKQILPHIWHSIFHPQELNCRLVVHVGNDDKLLRKRADSNIEPSSWEGIGPSSPTACIRLVARQERDLGDEDDTSTGYPDPPQATPKSALQKRDQSNVQHGTD
jgi:hypothetical protein